MSEKKLKVLVVGHVTHDDYDSEILPGGSAFYCSRAYYELGAGVTLITSVGRDFQCSEVFRGLDVLTVTADKTTHFFNTYPSDGIRVQKCTARAADILSSILPSDTPEFDVLHLAPVIGETDPVEWISAIKAKNVVLGLQGFLRCINNRDEVKPNNWHPPDSLKINTVFLSSEDLAGHNTLIAELMNNADTVVLTLGKKGSEIYYKSQKIKMGVYETKEVDPTGAGDIYSAAFTFARVSGMPVITAAQYGAAFASVIVEDLGGTSLKRLSEGLHRLKDISYKIL